jgi:hypothetical protein
MSNHASDAPPPDSSRDRRGGERLAAAVVTVVEVDGEDRSAMLRDLSVTGAMFLTRARLQVGDRVKLRVYTSSDLADPLLLEGSVVRAGTWDEGAAFWPFSVGVQFVEPATQHVERIREIGQRQAAMGLSFGKPAPR